MIRLECGVKAFDIHELLCHYVAKRLGYYADEGLDVVVRDRTFTRDEDLPQTSYFQVACGAAFFGRRAGHPFRVLFTAVDRPMFWLYGAPDVASVEELAGARVATYTPVAPPHHFNRLLLLHHGVDPDHDLSFEPVRDDGARLGLLAEGEVKAAAVSSAVSPPAVERRGLRTLALFGDHVVFPTTGVAASERMLDEQPEALGAVVRAFARALASIHEEPDRVVPVAADLLGEPVEAAERMLELVRHCWTRDGRVDRARLQSAIDTLEGILPGDGHVDAGDLYDYSLVP